MHTLLTKRPPRTVLLVVMAAALALVAGCASQGSELLQPEPRQAVFPLPEQYMSEYVNDLSLIHI